MKTVSGSKVCFRVLGQEEFTPKADKRDIVTGFGAVELKR
jgi:hypothetical protein